MNHNIMSTLHTFASNYNINYKTQIQGGSFHPYTTQRPQQTSATQQTQTQTQNNSTYRQSQNQQTNTHNHNHNHNHSNQQTYPNRTLCTFCSMIPDNAALMNTHTVSNCPYLKINICTNCFKRGHTQKYCTERNNVQVLKQKVHAETLAQEKVNKESLNMKEKYTLDIKLEIIKMRLNCAIEHQTHMYNVIHRGALKGQCNFCTKSKQYNEANVWQNNHTINICPKLAMVTCRTCHGRGHMDSHCPTNKKRGYEHVVMTDKSSDISSDCDRDRDSDDQEDAYIIDFDDYEMNTGIENDTEMDLMMKQDRKEKEEQKPDSKSESKSNEENKRMKTDENKQTRKESLEEAMIRLTKLVIR